ncbi:MAG: cysteine--tRNA ligase [Ignavibacterium sp.]
MLVIYNTLTKKKEEFKPLNPNEVKMYVCGPTVYDYFHIGNARSFINADFIRRYLEYKNYKVTFVMNLTDIDDKIIKKSIDEKKSAKEIADKYTQVFFEDIKKLKVKPATYYPKATENINEIIAMIQKLVDKNFAYVVDGDVYFDITKDTDYGKLSGKKLDELEVGARVEVDERKKNPLDFALWKKAKEGEPFWESPFGKGRPGWHIECSAMSCKYLGDTFDIHAGGSDLIFPHHENEIAQSESANEKPFVNYWIHFGFLNINEEKMSKSLGNFFTAREIVEKYSADVIRLFFAQAHYAAPLNFNNELLEATKKGLEKIQNFIFTINDGIKNANENNNNPKYDFTKYKSEFENAMDDDFNTPKAVAVIFDFIKDTNKIISEQQNLTKSFYIKLKEFLQTTLIDVLSIASFEEENKSSELVDDLINLLIKLRLEARQNKNYKLADQIRDELKELGIILQDSKERTTYKIL